MIEKIYLKNTEELTEASKAGEKVFMEYRDKEEEIEYAEKFGNYDWQFTLSAYSKLFPQNYVKFF